MHNCSRNKTNIAPDQASTICNHNKNNSKNSHNEKNTDMNEHHAFNAR